MSVEFGMGGTSVECVINTSNYQSWGIQLCTVVFWTRPI